MRICFIITRMDQMGGAQKHVTDLASHFSIEGNDVLIITGSKGSFCDVLINAGVEVKVIESINREILPIKDIKSIFYIRALLKNWRADVVSCHSSKAGVLGRISAFLAGVPVIYTAHGWSFADGTPERSKKIYIFIERLIAYITDFIINVSQADRCLALASGVGDAERSCTIYNGISLPLAPYRREPDPDERTKKVRVIMVARFGPQKDHETFIRALRICESLAQLEVLLIGGGDDRQVRSLITTLSLEKHVAILGERDNVSDMLSQSDIFVLSSNWEGLPYSIIEAQAHGLPVIATNVGGVSEIIDHETTGYLINRRDYQAMANYIDLLAQSKERRRRIGSQAHLYAKDTFGIERMYKAYAEVIGNVCGEAPRQRSKLED